jgi:hypothetical protein
MVLRVIGDSEAFKPCRRDQSGILGQLPQQELLDENMLNYRDPAHQARRANRQAERS